ncbi:electron transfer flavoprotein alpha subunit [Desulfitispora alkaliphila]|uniref:electron transfer flavoprotein subunit alpha/FixB family protein n=1 Tax=Desulfitispora alkaliphila TaxID=622674 RepID=UPI003D1FD71E
MANNEIWVIVEHSNGELKKVTSEALSKSSKLAEELGKTVCAVLLGEGVEQLKDTLGKYGAQKIYLAQDAKLKNYATDSYTHVIAELIKEKSPFAVFAGHTSMGKDLAPRLAQRVKTGLASDVVQIDVDGEQLKFVRPIYAGKAFSTVTIDKAEPIMATLRPNVFPNEPKEVTPEVEEVSVSIPEDALRAVIKEVLQSAGDKIQLTEADVIVSGGRGMKEPDNFKMLEELANELGAAVGASRAVVDAGWKAHEMQVGQTGKTVSPVLYIACGISGAIQHLAGMSSSKFIVAINKDADANIFNVADFGVVGDALKVVPLLTEEVKKIKSS